MDNLILRNIDYDFCYSGVYEFDNMLLHIV